MRGSFADQLTRNRFRPKKVIRRILDEHEKVYRSRPLPNYLTGTYNGVFFRIKVPPQKSLLPYIPKLPSSRPPPQKFKKVEPHARQSQVTLRLREWFSENWPVLVFNIGSICTLVGFTRSDVLELRLFSAAGSACGVVYNSVHHPRRWPPIIWGMTFASINLWKIYQIFRERRGTVHLTAAEEDVYCTHFLPHGVTPKQFESIVHCANTLHFKKGSILIRQGQRLRHVSLVVKGSTQASVLGRHVTAASTSPTMHEKRGGASGAWIGEMTFLENYWIKEQGKHISEQKDTRKNLRSQYEVKEDQQGEASLQSTLQATGETKLRKAGKQSAPSQAKSNIALYTIMAKEDCIVLQWSHSDMEALMQRSTDIRAAMTRAMASAIVGKVINFTVSRSTGTGLSWTGWLSDWKNVDSVRVQIENDAEELPDSGERSARGQSNTKDEVLPTYPIKEFR